MNLQAFKIKGDGMLGRIFSKSFWIKVILYLASVGMVVSCVAFYKGLEGYKSVCLQENYVDKGVHEFRPLRVVRTSNSDGIYNSSRKARMREENSAKWLVIYRAVDKSGYGFKRSFGISKLKAQEAKKEGNVKRRVLEAVDSQGKKHIYVVKEHESISTHFDSQVAYYSRLLTLPLFVLTALSCATVLVFQGLQTQAKRIPKPIIKRTIVSQAQSPAYAHTQPLALLKIKCLGSGLWP